MVIDTSAVVAILLDEPESPVIRRAIEDDPVRLMSTASFVEAAMVIETRFGEAGGRELDLLLHTARIELIPVDREQAELARDAFRQFGKGRHRAGLNFGDCFSYALARVSGERLLFKGDDFGHTDVEQVLG
ncbi:MAG TPA: type II toxin-antitoxin system VapC family toxin [Candidatus Sulfomarinibacteraceae bacterium]|nr:type II toxin-antitoxin system VapC family toxin [Candidatus Sulfomarinibacteraceae bacterium]